MDSEGIRRYTVSLSLVSSVALRSAKVWDDLEAFGFKAFDDLSRCALGDDVSGPCPNTVAVHVDAVVVFRLVRYGYNHRAHPLSCVKQTLLEPSCYPSIT